MEFYASNGLQQFVPVPLTAADATIQLWGGDGGENGIDARGRGGYVVATVPVAGLSQIELRLGEAGLDPEGPSDSATLREGGKSYNNERNGGNGGIQFGGTNTRAAGSGGAGSSALFGAQLFVAGGGSGVGNANIVERGNSGGGLQALPFTTSDNNGMGGDQVSAGAGGPYLPKDFGTNGNAGTLGVGGDGVMQDFGGGFYAASGGAGGGWRGGGSGAITRSGVVGAIPTAHQSGGGSSLAPLGATYRMDQPEYVSKPNDTREGMAIISFRLVDSTGPIEVNTVDPRGATVYFVAPPNTHCCPGSGSWFPVGVSYIECTDEHGRSFSRKVTVTTFY